MDTPARRSHGPTHTLRLCACLFLLAGCGVDVLEPPAGEVLEITGTVTREGQPVDSAHVSVFSSRRCEALFGGSIHCYMAGTVTDARGRYQVEDEVSRDTCRRGRSEVSFTEPGQAWDPTRGTVVVEGCRRHTVNHDFSLAPNG